MKNRGRPQSGSLTSLAWTPDGTQIAGAGGNGAVVFGQVIERSLEWGNFEVSQRQHASTRISRENYYTSGGDLRR